MLPHQRLAGLDLDIGTCVCRERELLGPIVIDRYYDSATGQFLSVDPEVATTGQPYSFTGDDPLNKTDPLGLRGWTWWQGRWQWFKGNKHPSGISGRTQYATILLATLHIRANSQNVRALVTWQARESPVWSAPKSEDLALNNPSPGAPHSDIASVTKNPLNNTLGRTGHSQNWIPAGGTSYVQKYDSWPTSVDLTAENLQNGAKSGIGGYGPILNALHSGTTCQIEAAVLASGWGTHGIGC